eukprot:symbB.v1.2.007036.t1/scaffold428.1/size206322/11
MIAKQFAPVRRPADPRVLKLGPIGPTSTSRWEVQTSHGGGNFAALTAFTLSGLRCARSSTRRSRGARVSEPSGFFDTWAKWFEADFVAKMDLEEELLLPEFAERITAHPFSDVEEALITSRVWKEKATEPSLIRRARSVRVNAGAKVQAFNVVVYPSYNLGLQPVLGVDLLSFSSNKQLLFGVDWAPMLADEAYAEAKIAPFLSSILDEFEHLRTSPSGKVYGENPEFFSPYMFFSRPQDKEALQRGSELWKVSAQYFDRCAVLELKQIPFVSRIPEISLPSNFFQEGEVPSALARKRQERKEENRREKQRQLDWIFREVEISWDQVLKFMRFDDLQPNIKEAGTGITSLHRASSAGQADVLQWCIRTKAEIDCCTQMGRSALHYACECSRPRCVRILLDHKADANLRTLSYLTPLHLACQANSVEAVTVLLENANQVVDVDAEDTKGRSAEARPFFLLQEKPKDAGLEESVQHFDQVKALQS